MTTTTEVRSMRTEDVVRMARDQAERHEAMQHYFEPGTLQATAYERAYIARQVELEQPEV